MDILKYFKPVGIIGMMCLLSSSVVFTSCSSDDDEPESIEQNTDGRKQRQLTIAEVPVTRATLEESESKKSLTASWIATRDKATYFNLSTFSPSTIEDGILTATESSKVSAFTGTVSCELNHYIALIYPTVKIADGTNDGETRGDYTIKLSGQMGTLEDIATNYHYIYGVGKVTATTENPATATASIISMNSLLAVAKFKFKDAATKDAIPVKTLTINYGDAGFGFPQNGKVTPSTNAADVVATPEAQTKWEGHPLIVNLDTETSNGVYVALFPCGNEYPEQFHFTVTGSAGTYTGTANAKLQAGKYYPVTLTLTK